MTACGMLALPQPARSLARRWSTVSNSVTYDEVEKNYGPIVEAPVDDWDNMEKYDPNRIITLVSCDPREPTFIAGWSYVNRLQYRLTSKPMPEEWVKNRIVLEDSE